MNKLTIILLIFCQPLFGQENIQKQELLELAKIYKENHAFNQSDKVFLQLDSINTPSLQGAKKFIRELIKENNSICATEYLIKPDSTTLWNLYLIRGLTWKMFDFDSVYIDYDLESLLGQKIGYNEQLANYYSMLFTSVLNKVSPFDLSNIDLEMNQYNLENEEEKGIFFLESMEAFGTLISGYFRVNPPNFNKAMDFITKYPLYNGESYYKYLELQFEDFDYTYTTKKPRSSYKKHQINLYMNVVLYHIVSLSQEESERAQINKIMENSILANEEYWKFSESTEVLKQIYQK